MTAARGGARTASRVADSAMQWPPEVWAEMEDACLRLLDRAAPSDADHLARILGIWREESA